MPVSILHAHIHAACQRPCWTWTCSMDMPWTCSMNMNMVVQTACCCPCCMSASKLHVYAAWPSPYLSMSMLHGPAHTAFWHEHGHAAWRGHAAWTWTWSMDTWTCTFGLEKGISMDMDTQHVLRHVAWTWTCDMDGQWAWTWTWTCSMSILMRA